MVEKESKGKYKFQNYMNGMLNNARHGFRAVSSGTCDLTHGYPVYNAASFQISLVDYLPYIFPSNHVAVLVMEELYPKYFKEEYERQGGYMAFWINTSDYVLLTKKPVRSIDDLKGMKIRAGGGISTEATAALGAVPVSVLPAETYTSVQSGVVDGAILPAGTLTSYKVHEVAKYCTRLNGFTYTGVPFVLRRGFFDALSPEQKDYFYRKLRQCAQSTSNGYNIDEKESFDLMKASGVEIIDLPPQEIERMRKAVQPVYDKFIADCKAKGLPAEELLKDIKLLVDKYGKMTPEETYEHVTKNPIKGIINY